MHSRNTYECPLSSWRALGLLQSLSKVVHVMVTGFSVFTVELGRCFLILCHGAGTGRWRYVCDTSKRSSQVKDASLAHLGEFHWRWRNSLSHTPILLFKTKECFSVPALSSVTENLAGCFWLGCWAVMFLLACEINYLQPKNAVHRSLTEEAEKQFMAWLGSMCLGVTVSV